MIIIPAIDIKEGKVVRLFQGKFDDTIVYSSDPVKTALHWLGQGAQMLHVVDLDGAASGKPVHVGAVKKICRVSKVPIECGGGVRSLDNIQMLLDAGVWRVVLGTKAVQDKEFLKKAFKKYGEKIIVSIDAKGGVVCINGWQKASEARLALEFAQQLKDMGVTQVIYTDISKDGTLQGPSIAQIKGLLKKTGLQVIASGGISSLEDILKLKSLETQGVVGLITGKALYEGRFTVAQAIKAGGKSGMRAG